MTYVDDRGTYLGMKGSDLLELKDTLDAYNLELKDLNTFLKTTKVTLFAEIKRENKILRDIVDKVHKLTEDNT